MQRFAKYLKYGFKWKYKLREDGYRKDKIVSFQSILEILCFLLDKFSSWKG